MREIGRKTEYGEEIIKYSIEGMKIKDTDRNREEKRERNITKTKRKRKNWYRKKRIQEKND